MYRSTHQLDDNLDDDLPILTAYLPWLTSFLSNEAFSLSIFLFLQILSDLGYVLICFMYWTAGSMKLFVWASLFLQSHLVTVLNRSSLLLVSQSMYDCFASCQSLMTQSLNCAQVKTLEGLPKS